MDDQPDPAMFIDCRVLQGLNGHPRQPWSGVHAVHRDGSIARTACLKPSLCRRGKGEREMRGLLNIGAVVFSLLAALFWFFSAGDNLFIELGNKFGS
jgi:hypothetical protein